MIPPHAMEVIIAAARATAEDLRLKAKSLDQYGTDKLAADLLVKGAVQVENAIKEVKGD